MLATTYAIASGIESMSRSFWYLWLITVVFFALAVFMALPMVKISGLLPIGEAGIKNTLKSSLLAHAFWGEIFWLVILFPYIRSKREAFMGGLAATILLSIFVSLTIVLCITIMGVETTARAYFSVFSLSDYLESAGIKAVLATIWIMTFWGKITLSQFSITIGLSQLCGFKDHRALILPVAMMLLIFSHVFYPNNTDLFSSVKNTFTSMGLLFEYILPTALLIVAILKQKLGILNNPAASDQVQQGSPNC
jgi:spore germination protein KB